MNESPAEHARRVGEQIVARDQAELGPRFPA